jgi:large subunit ribosomal protein L6
VSRVGKAPIPVPQEVTVNVQNNVVTAKGPKGELSVKIHPEILIAYENGVIQVQRPNDSKLFRSLHGLSRTLVANNIEGVQKGFTKRLEIVGVGYRAEIRGKKLLLTLGFAHQILFIPPPEIQITVEGNNVILVTGIHKELVGQIAAKIRSLRPPEPYKGKGIRYAKEVVRKKAGKTAA